MRRILLLPVFLVVLLVTAAAYVPLGYVLKHTSLNQMGIGWAKVDGTLRQGRISGFYIRNQPIGDITLDLRLTSLLSLSPTYDVQWGGAGGLGSGVIALRRNAIEGSDIQAQQQIGALEGLAAPARVFGGSIRLNNGAFLVTPQGCDTASGNVSTDALHRVAEDYGTDFKTLSGPIRCDEGAFVLDLAGVSGAGDEVSITAQSSIFGAATVEMGVITPDNKIAFALSQFGFESENGVWVYRHGL